MALQEGSSGSEVRALQQALNEAGYDPGPIDGVFGPRTSAALRSWQSANDMEPTGIADPAVFEGLGMDNPEEDDEAGEGARMNLPGAPELWKVGNASMLVYVVPDTQPPVYIMWKAPDDEDVQSFFGPDQEIVYDQEMSWAEMRDLGGLVFGTTDELANFDDDPFASWTYMMETEAQSQPWIMDEDYQGLIAMAILEGRTLTDAEIQSTGWWRDHSSSEREWMKLYHGDPSEAQRRIEDNRALARQVLTDSGLTGFGNGLIEFLADKVTMGHWSETYFNTQVQALSDPASRYQMDEELAEFTENLDRLDATIEHRDTVANLVNEWIGPTMGKWDDDKIEKWAGILRQDPNGEQRLVEMLKNQRQALFPEYEDRNLSYNDIAEPWRNYGFAEWGQKMDETDPMFMRMVRNNDVDLNGQLLRRKGLQQGIGKVVENTNEALLQGTGGSVRQQVR